ncbi:DUF3060 domain-containing protein [Actinomyces viscosus]|uniref:DUF3060 domain-containing protein n=1 Tax=Actinomyces viscosus TaxID=1656 RepID=UPI0028E94624|nr:DUF3060 domain-containing protein [Actinomyces viscosus]
MSPTTRPLSSRRAAAAILITLSLAGVSACSVSIGGGSTNQGAATTASQEVASPGQSTAAAQPSKAATGSQTPRPEAAASSTQEPAAQAAQTASAGASAPGAGSQQVSGDRPGAQATITDHDWLSDLESVDRTVSATPSMLLDQANDEVRVEGDVANLNISANNVRVFVDYVGLLTVTGTNAEVYVKDVDRVVIKGSNAEVVWAGNTPKIEDFGSNTETRQQGAKRS